MQTTVPLACFLSLIPFYNVPQLGVGLLQYEGDQAKVHHAGLVRVGGLSMSFENLLGPPGIQFENALLQIAPVDKGKCPFVRDNIDVVFQLYTRHNPTVPHNLIIDDDESLFASSINFNDPTVIYFHAFMETPDDGSALMIREAYTHRGDTNVIMVDAQRLEAGPWYFKAAENTWYIGRTGAQFIDYLVSRGLNLSKTHLVGHSLGAQSAGVAGSSIKSGRVSRITGLDPALPLFNKLPLHQRLDPSDAEFVDVIHTDAGIFGYNQQVGHVDFYPNGGISPQPGCELEVTIPQQQFLNKCDNTTHFRSNYVYHLQANRQQSRTDKQTKIHNAITIARSINIKRNTLKNSIKSEKKSMENGLNPNNLSKNKNKRPKKTIHRQKNHRERRFISFFKPQTNDSTFHKILSFILKHHKKVLPVITVIREINTLIKTGNGEFSNYINEQHNFIGTSPTLQPVTYNFDFNNESRIKSIFRKLFGLKQENNISISTK